MFNWLSDQQDLKGQSYIRFQLPVGVVHVPTRAEPAHHPKPCQHDPGIDQEGLRVMAAVSHRHHSLAYWYRTL